MIRDWYKEISLVKTLQKKENTTILAFSQKLSILLSQETIITVNKNDFKG